MGHYLLFLVLTQLILCKCSLSHSENLKKNLLMQVVGCMYRVNFLKHGKIPEIPAQIFEEFTQSTHNTGLLGLTSDVMRTL